MSSLSTKSIKERRSRETVSLQNQMFGRVRSLVKDSSLTWQIKYSRGFWALLWGGAAVKNLQNMSPGKDCVQPEQQEEFRWAESQS